MTFRERLMFAYYRMVLDRRVPRHDLMLVIGYIFARYNGRRFLWNHSGH